jgi:hypothetical protein
MIQTSTAERPIDAPPSNYYRQPFLASHKAVAACTREFVRLCREVLDGVEALPGATPEEKAVVRQSPDRCIVQLGPVALTLAWLRGTHDSVAMGELLVIVWRGSVAPRTKHQPERRVTGPVPLAATSLWEQVLTPMAESEASWAWQPRGTEVAGCSSSELATRCVGRLSVAYLEGREVPPSQ